MTLVNTATLAGEACAVASCLLSPSESVAGNTGEKVIAFGAIECDIPTCIADVAGYLAPDSIVGNVLIAGRACMRHDCIDLDDLDVGIAVSGGESEKLNWLSGMTPDAEIANDAEPYASWEAGWLTVQMTVTPIASIVIVGVADISVNKPTGLMGLIPLSAGMAGRWVDDLGGAINISAVAALPVNVDSACSFDASVKYEDRVDWAAGFDWDAIGAGASDPLGQAGITPSMLVEKDSQRCLLGSTGNVAVACQNGDASGDIALTAESATALVETTADVAVEATASIDPDVHGAVQTLPSTRGEVSNRSTFHAGVAVAVSGTHSMLHGVLEGHCETRPTAWATTFTSNYEANNPLLYNCCLSAVATSRMTVAQAIVIAEAVDQLIRQDSCISSRRRTLPPTSGEIQEEELYRTGAITAAVQYVLRDGLTDIAEMALRIASTYTAIITPKFFPAAKPKALRDVKAEPNRYVHAPAVSAASSRNSEMQKQERRVVSLPVASLVGRKYVYQGVKVVVVGYNEGRGQWKCLQDDGGVIYATSKDLNTKRRR